MNRTYEQVVQDNTLELERLIAIYNQVNDYVKQLSNMSLTQLQDSLEQAHNLDAMFTPDPNEYGDWV